MDYLGKGEVLSNTDFDRFVNNIWERKRPFVYIEKVLDFWVQLMKNGGKNKSVAFIILYSVRRHIKQIEQFCTAKNSWKQMTPEARPIKSTNGCAYLFGKNNGSLTILATSNCCNLISDIFNFIRRNCKTNRIIVTCVVKCIIYSEEERGLCESAWLDLLSHCIFLDTL